MGKRGKAISALPMTDQQRKLLVQLLNAHGTAQQMAKRIKILLLAHQGQSHTEICIQAGVSYKTVLSWRKRWQSAYEQLSLYASKGSAKDISDRELSKYLLNLLTDLPRSGAPKVFTLEQRQQLVALACDKPDAHGIPISGWTHEMLAKTAIAKGIVDSISASHLGKILKKITPYVLINRNTGFFPGLKIGIVSSYEYALFANASFQRCCWNGPIGT